MIGLPVLLLIFAVLMGSTGTMAVFVHLLTRVRRRERERGISDEAGLMDEVVQSRRELEEVKRELATLRESVDFTERLLAEPRRGPREPL